MAIKFLFKILRHVFGLEGIMQHGRILGDWESDVGKGSHPQGTLYPERVKDPLYPAPNPVRWPLKWIRTIYLTARIEYG